MNAQFMKRAYLATVCLPPPLLLILYPLVFIGGVKFPTEWLPLYAFYFWIGLVVVLIDLWRSKQPQGTKIIWTVLNVFLGLIFLPIYWFKYVLKSGQES